MTSNDRNCLNIDSVGCYPYCLYNQHKYLYFSMFFTSKCGLSNGNSVCNRFFRLLQFLFWNSDIDWLVGVGHDYREFFFLFKLVFFLPFLSWRKVLDRKHFRFSCCLFNLSWNAVSACIHSPSLTYINEIAWIHVSFQPTFSTELKTAQFKCNGKLFSIRVTRAWKNSLKFSNFKRSKKFQFEMSWKHVRNLFYAQQLV